MDEDLKNQWKTARTQLIISIGEQIGIEKEQQILMMMSLNTPEKIYQFNEWAKARTENNKINSTPNRVLSAATRIGRGMKPLD